MNERHIFSPEYEAKKKALLCAVREESEKKGFALSAKTIKTAAICAVCALAIVGGAVMIKTAPWKTAIGTPDLSKTASNDHADDAGMNASTNGTATFITAKMNTDPTLPKREWNFGEGEVGIKLGYGYFPEDLSEDQTAPYKYGSASDASRMITVCGYDLRTSEMNAKVAESQLCEKLTLGGHAAYLVTGTEISRYDRDLYVFFEEDELIVRFMVGYGVLDAEIKEIAEKLTVSETTDVDEAMPIWKAPTAEEVTGEVLTSGDPYENTDTDVKFGEKVSGMAFDYAVNGVEVRDTLAGLDESCLDVEFPNAEYFIGNDGILIPYERTELIHGDGVNVKSGFGETKMVQKKLVIVEYTVSGREDMPFDKVLFAGFSVAYLKTDADGRAVGYLPDTVVGHVPGGFSETVEPVYAEWEDGVSGISSRPIGECDGMKLKIGYLIDEDMLGDLYAVGGKLSGGFDFAIKLG